MDNGSTSKLCSQSHTHEENMGHSISQLLLIPREGQPVDARTPGGDEMGCAWGWQMVV